MSFCIDIIDYIAHLDVLMHACDMLAQKDCRILISGINAAHLDTISFDKVPASVFKINWSEGLTERKDIIRALIKKIGTYRVILHRCETEREIQAGLSCGIQQFQGFGIDKLLKSKSDV